MDVAGLRRMIIS